MEKITVYGLPLTPRPLIEELAGRSFCISFATRKDLGKQLDDAIRLVGEDQILIVDNGAWSHHCQGGEMTEEYVEAFEAWATEILERCPQAIAVIPDVIGGTVEQNAELINTTMLPQGRTMAIWHLDEPISSLLHRAECHEWIGFGSSGIYHDPRSAAWRARVAEAFAALEQWELESDGAYIRPRIHMMRAQSQAHLFPFDSSDSTNLARNHCRYKHVERRAAFLAGRIDAKIQASAGAIAEHQIKRPLLGHLEMAAWERQHQAYLLELKAELDAARQARQAPAIAPAADLEPEFAGEDLELELELPAFLDRRPSAGVGQAVRI